MTAIEILESSKMRTALPHLFPDILTRECITTTARDELVIPATALAAILRWSTQNSEEALDISTALESI